MLFCMDMRKQIEVVAYAMLTRYISTSFCKASVCDFYSWGKWQGCKLMPTLASLFPPIQPKKERAHAHTCTHAHKHAFKACCRDKANLTADSCAQGQSQRMCVRFCGPLCARAAATSGAEASVRLLAAGNRQGGCWLPADPTNCQ